VKIVIETIIAAPAERCFDMARDVATHEESAAFSGEKLVPPGRLEGTLELGDLVAFEGRHFGLRQTFVARIIEITPPRRFVDEMVKGAFRRLRHEHEFLPHAEGTLMRDILEWESPLGPIGRLADALFVRKHMTWFVTMKQRELKRLIERQKAEGRGQK
jgi:ligand-binding SRPBCC domain-containing protein